MQACRRCGILYDPLINPETRPGHCRWCVEELTLAPAQLARHRHNGDILTQLAALTTDPE